MAVKKCPECNSSKLITDETRGEIICGSCGLLVEENMVDTSHELRSFDKSEKNNSSTSAIKIFKTTTHKPVQVTAITQQDLFK